MSLKINFRNFSTLTLSISEHITLISLSAPIASLLFSQQKLIKVKVWERGAGLTKACGTAACATAFAAKKNHLVENKVDIEFSTGKLSISIDQNESIHMKGPVSDIKNIEIEI